MVLMCSKKRVRARLAVLAAINATGYGLTFGVHTRIDETIARVTSQAQAGNIYVNRNLVGAVVGVQPFGGHGLSGTGPKAGGPLYLRRLLGVRPPETGLPSHRVPSPARDWADWLGHSGFAGAETTFREDLARTPFGVAQELPGPVGERNLYATEARGRIWCIAADSNELLHQIGAALATGNHAVIAAAALPRLPAWPAALAGWVMASSNPEREDVAAILFSGPAATLQQLN